MSLDTMNDTEMKLQSSDILEQRTAAFKDLFPEAFTEGKVDFEKLRLALGEQVRAGRERYGLTWAGKADAMRAVQIPSTATLVPVRDESVDWDTTKNVFIEGENLEVLKLLQKSYCGRVKMIYIDPPYNTGNEFIYLDDYRDSVGKYLRLTGQISGEGEKLTTNTETSGRYHSNWLNMMYPRLFLARNLLRDDGVIFVSIDDHEIQNLRCIMDEIFGEENFVTTVIWQKVFAPKNTAQHFSQDHDYVLVYGRNASSWVPEMLPRTDEANERYTNPDDDSRGPWAADNLTARNYYSLGQYEVTSPSGKTFSPPVGRYWAISHEKFKQLDIDNRIYWGPTKGNMPRLKRFLSEVKQGLVPQTLWLHDQVGHTQEAKQILVDHVAFGNTENVLNSVKPPRLIQRMIQIGTKPTESSIVLDFFAGSATTAHAVLLQNCADAGTRQFICVQFPEMLPKPEAKLRTIVDIGTERLRSLRNEFADKQHDLGLHRKPDIGFRLYRFTTSNFKTWNADYKLLIESAVAEQLRLHTDHVLPERSQEDILIEILLKAGYPLTSRINRIEVAGQHAFSISDGNLIICLATPIHPETLRAIIGLQPRPIQVICLDHGFEGNDQIKTNLKLEMESHGIEFRTV
jgi:adenine-specific DNA-methyltransferase